MMAAEAVRGVEPSNIANSRTIIDKKLNAEDSHENMKRFELQSIKVTMLEAATQVNPSMHAPTSPTLGRIRRKPPLTIWRKAGPYLKQLDEHIGVDAYATEKVRE
jgi:hypothetical protein